VIGGLEKQVAVFETVAIFGTAGNPENPPQRILDYPWGGFSVSRNSLIESGYTGATWRQ
jgi:hypothetical protein